MKFRWAKPDGRKIKQWGQNEYFQSKDFITEEYLGMTQERNERVNKKVEMKKQMKNWEKIDFSLYGSWYNSISWSIINEAKNIFTSNNFNSSYIQDAFNRNAY